jgi:hypothetical protein
MNAAAVRRLDRSAEHGALRHMICAALLQTRLAASSHWFGWCLSPQL